MTKLKSVEDLESLKGKSVLLRSDLNVPLTKSGQASDDYKIEKSLPTMKLLLKKGARLFIASHLGQPDGPDKNLSLRPLAAELSRRLGKKVVFIEDPFDLKDSKDLIDARSSGNETVYLLENLRFWPGEERNEKSFSLALVNALGIDIFVQDAFGAAHRAHSVNMQIPKLLPSFVGLLIGEELDALNRFKDAKNPSLIVGGAKAESKLNLISGYLPKARDILVGGVVLNTILKANGKSLGASKVDEKTLEDAKELLARSSANGSANNAKLRAANLDIPKDVICGRSLGQLVPEECPVDEIKPGEMVLDVGRLSLAEFLKRLESGPPRAYFWAGTLGYAENPTFAAGSKAVLRKLIELKRRRSRVRIVIGGGDTAAFVREQLGKGELQLIDHLSTSGGSCLKLLGGESLPAVEAVRNSKVTVENAQNPAREKEDAGRAKSDKVLALNLKSNFTRESFLIWLDKVAAEILKLKPENKVLICAPYTLLEAADEVIKKLGAGRWISIFAEDISSQQEGPYTGSIAADMLEGLADGTMIGHSERRVLLHESNGIVATKLKSALTSNLGVILCVGGSSHDLVTNRRETQIQLLNAMRSMVVESAKVDSETAARLKFAYEPVFAVGSGRVPSGTFLAAQLGAIREILSKYGAEGASVLYGGSVDYLNVEEILEIGFDGVLVGSDSLVAKDLFRLMEVAL